MLIRKAVPNDAEKLVFLMKHVEESNVMLFEPGERNTTSQQLNRRLTTMNDSSIVFTAEEHNELVGYVFAIGEEIKRKQHSVYIVIGVHQANRGKGTGTQLLRAVEKWAIEKALRRIELTVVAHNTLAIALYEKLGFSLEGVKRDSLYIEGKYVDELYMSKLL
ncbi:GNAT family N-acetyltransferase [Planococcus donghaensis]|uniref:GNAT family N-acetyltransferase n=1 Tax=Planococcus donghaensis TaxID=414778 RepID=A0A1C7EHW9_9BACL|nr:GNAT family N-acetyltransferase [Planococcus donghaensis]ANU23241.1 GNAT family N-acetyltransferase [Planococcus donghaensis]